MTTVAITFHNETVHPRMHPGETLQGTVTVTPHTHLDCKHLYIRLLWHTEGRGTRYVEKVEEIDVFQGVLPRGRATSFEFSFVMPQAPWSHKGHYVSVVWKVQAQIDLPWVSDLQRDEPLILRPLPHNQTTK